MKKKDMVFIGLSIVAAVLISGLTIYQAVDKVNADNKAERERKDAVAAREEARLAQEDLRDALKQNKHLTEKLVDKSDSIKKDSEKLINDQIETLRQINGYGVLKITSYTNADNKIRFILENTSNYPIRDVSLYFIEFTEELKSKFKNGIINNKELEKNTLHLRQEWGILKPDAINFLATDDNRAGFKAYEVTLNCQHAKYRQLLIFFCNPETGEERTWSRLYDITQKPPFMKLIEESAEPKQNKNDKVFVDKLFEKYFITSRYKIQMDQ